MVSTRLAGSSLLPRGRLDATDVESFEAAVARTGGLDSALAACERGMDLVVVDTPSGLGRVTTAALAASDFALLAFQTENLALRSLGQALAVVEHVQARPEPAPPAHRHPADTRRARAGRQPGRAERDLERLPRRPRDRGAAQRSLRTRERTRDSGRLPGWRRWRTRVASLRSARRRDRGTNQPPRRHGEGA